MLHVMLLPPSELPLGEAYVCGDLDLEGDLEAVFPLAEHLLETRTFTAMQRLGLAVRLLALPTRDGSRPDGRAARLRGRKNSPARDREAVTYHYDRSNEFVALFLDRRLVCSCAYFAEPGLDIDAELAPFPLTPRI